MINGIRVLAETPIYIIEYSAGWSWAGFIWSIFTLLFLIGTIAAIIKDEDIALFGFLSATLCVLLSVFSFTHEHSEKVFDHTEYKVLINEEVNFIEFNEKYEIINQEGEIFTIIEKLQD